MYFNPVWFNVCLRLRPVWGRGGGLYGRKEVVGFNADRLGPLLGVWCPLLTLIGLRSQVREGVVRWGSWDGDISLGVVLYEGVVMTLRLLSLCSGRGGGGGGTLLVGSEDLKVFQNYLDSKSFFHTYTGKKTK
ncbi:unnamed protein product [Arctogadus glacialis]